MQITPSRRDFITGLTAAAATGLIGARSPLADEGPPEVTTVRLRLEVAPGVVVGGVAENPICIAPVYIADELLRAEGFTDIEYIPLPSGALYAAAFTRGDIDFGAYFAANALRRLDEGVPVKVLAGVHVGCFELFAHEHIRGVADLRGRKVGIYEAIGSADYLYVAIMVSYVGLDPDTDIEWVTVDEVDSPMELFARGEIDAYLAFVPEPQELRARGIGRVIFDMATDKPWSNYFCCLLAGNADFVRQHPIATKRVVRAILKAVDLCATEPERAARQLIEGGFVHNYGYAHQVLTELPYGGWRDIDPEDSLRFYALWLHQFGMISSTPNQLISAGTDWRILHELKQELKI